MGRRRPRRRRNWARKRRRPRRRLQIRTRLPRGLTTAPTTRRLDQRTKKRTRMRRRPSWRHCWPRERRSWQKCNENPPRQFSLHFRDTFLRNTLLTLGIEKFVTPVTRPPRDQQVPDLPTNPASSSFTIKGINVNHHRVPLNEHFPFLSASVVLTK